MFWGKKRSAEEIELEQEELYKKEYAEIGQRLKSKSVDVRTAMDRMHDLAMKWKRRENLPSEQNVHGKEGRVAVIKRSVFYEENTKADRLERPFIISAEPDLKNNMWPRVGRSYSW